LFCFLFATVNKSLADVLKRLRWGSLWSSIRVLIKRKYIENSPICSG